MEVLHERGWGVSQFPGQHSYGEFASRQRERDLEEGRHDVRPAERSEEFHGLTEALVLRIVLLKCTKADLMTSTELDKTIRALEAALDAIRRRDDEIDQLRQQARKAGDSEAK